MQFNTITASLVLLFCNALTANAAPLPTTADLAVRDVQAPRSIEWEMTKRANPASNHGGTTGAGAPGGAAAAGTNNPAPPNNGGTAGAGAPAGGAAAGANNPAPNNGGTAGPGAAAGAAAAKGGRN